MALPGGFRAGADADLLATAIRETREEVGIDLAADGFVGCLGDVSPALNDVTVRPFVFVRDRVPDVITSQEVQAATWVDLESVARGSSRTSHEFEHGGSRQRFPGFRVGEQVVWGMTYRILLELVELVGRAFSLRGAPPQSALPVPGQALETVVQTGRRH
jgi:ADP-ribose pyrophosphatase YjhB (NUDIX family)